MRRILTSLMLIGLLTGCHAVPTSASQQASLGAGVLARHKSERDVSALVRKANAPLATRDAKLIARKYDLLADNPFSFFRGTAYLFYADVAATVDLKSAIAIPLMGDLHLENLGTYRTAKGEIAYDLNDFDEAATGSYTWELARMAVSVHLAAAQSGLKHKHGAALTEDFLAAYGRHLRTLNAAALARPLTDGDAQVKAAIAKARSASRAEFLADLGEAGRFKLGKKRFAVTPETARQVESAVAAYAKGRPEGAGFFHVKDVAARLAGTASIGRYRYVAWLEGPSSAANDDLVLELKEQVAPSLQPGASGDHARRVLAAYRYFLVAPDPLLGTARLGGQDFIVRELSPAKESVELTSLEAPEAFERYLDTVALATARAHARSGKQAAILAELPSKMQPIAAFAEAYAEQVEVDHAAFKRSMKD